MVMNKQSHLTLFRKHTVNMEIFLKEKFNIMPLRIYNIVDIKVQLLDRKLLLIWTKLDLDKYFVKSK